MRELLFHFELNREHLSLGFFSEIKSNFKFLSHSAIILKLCRRDKSQKQCSIQYIKLTFCSQAGLCHGLQHIRNLGSKVKAHAQQNWTLISVKTFGSASVPPLLWVLNFSRKVFFKAIFNCWQAVLSLDSAYICLCWVVVFCAGIWHCQRPGFPAQNDHLWYWSLFYAVVAKISG